MSHKADNTVDCRKCDFYSARRTGGCRNALVVRHFGLSKVQNRVPAITKARSKDSPCGSEGKLFCSTTITEEML